MVVHKDDGADVVMCEGITVGTDTNVDIYLLSDIVTNEDTVGKI